MFGKVAAEADPNTSVVELVRSTSEALRDMDMSSGDIRDFKEEGLAAIANVPSDTPGKRELEKVIREFRQTPQEFIKGHLKKTESAPGPSSLAQASLDTIPYRRVPSRLVKIFSCTTKFN